MLCIPIRHRHFPYVVHSPYGARVWRACASHSARGCRYVYEREKGVWQTRVFLALMTAACVGLGIFYGVRASLVTVHMPSPTAEAYLGVYNEQVCARARSARLAWSSSGAALCVGAGADLVVCAWRPRLA